MSEFKLPLYVKKAQRDLAPKRDASLAALGDLLGGQWQLEVDFTSAVAGIFDFFKAGGESANCPTVANCPTATTVTAATMGMMGLRLGNQCCVSRTCMQWAPNFSPVQSDNVMFLLTFGPGSSWRRRVFRRQQP